jgi:hypothetical protein
MLSRKGYTTTELVVTIIVTVMGASFFALIMMILIWLYQQII